MTTTTRSTGSFVKLAGQAQDRLSSLRGSRQQVLIGRRSCLWRSFIARSIATPTLTRCSRRRSRVSRPTQQFPELAEAQTLLSTLSESDAVKIDASERFSAYYRLRGGHLSRGEPAPMREIAELRDLIALGVLCSSRPATALSIRPAKMTDEQLETALALLSRQRAGWTRDRAKRRGAIEPIMLVNAPHPSCEDDSE